MKNEEWKIIPNTNGQYEASNFGRIRSKDGFKKGITKNGKEILRKKKGQIVKGNLNKSRGYWMTCVNKKKRFTHRWVAETWLPKIEGKNQVNNKDGNRLNNSLENLEWCDCLENIRHARKMGSYDELNKNTAKRVKGSGNPRAILNEQKVIEIKKLLEKKIKQSQIAKMFNVKHGVISFIANNRTWKHVIL